MVISRAMQQLTPDFLVDPFGRQIDYLRISVTDRCDFRCVYCMAEEMVFLPRHEILSLEEVYWISRAFTELGVKRIRITGGEPLVRNGLLSLLDQLSDLPGLSELLMTTNGSNLAEMAVGVKTSGVTRLNISLDTLDPVKFKSLTRTGDLNKVLSGIEAAKAAGYSRIKINAVILKNRNHDEVIDLVRYCIANEFDISFIEEMPLGEVSHSRAEAFYSSDDILRDLKTTFSMTALTSVTGGPSVYWQVNDSLTKVGFISPHSHNFCSTCNRVRLTAEGRLLLCLGNEHSVDLKEVIRHHPGDIQFLKQAIVDAIKIKPERHYFEVKEQPVILRHMNKTGG